MSTTEPWPPNYVEVFKARQQRLMNLRKNPHLWAGAREYYRTRPAEFIEHWGTTYDPRNAGDPEKLTTMPFIMFERQREMVEWLMACLDAQTDGLDEKCRDMGATWTCVGFSAWLWLFMPGSAVGWGSRKQDLVDKIGDMDSIFEKIRAFLRGLPREFMPVGLVPATHLTFMKCINPENGATITGESGDNIGRGGRKLIYFKDESAHYERPELIEAALGDNTNVQIDISSVNGLGNVFHRKAENAIMWERGAPALRGKVNKFVMDWRDHPAKDQAWYDLRRAKAVEAGLLHVFEQEVNRNYAASVTGVIIPFDWIMSAVDADIKLGFKVDGGWCAALDVADNDGGGDLNAFSLRQGVCLRSVNAWGERDVGVTTRRALGATVGLGPLDVQYDCIGMGSTVKAEANRLKDKGDMPKGVRLIPWDAGSNPLHPKARVIPGDIDSPRNGDFYANLKAQGWWMLRLRFERTHRAVTEQGFTYNIDDLISLDGTMQNLHQLTKELAQPTSGYSGRMKLMVNKTPDGTRSPNLGDSVMMNFWPVPPKDAPVAVFGVYASHAQR
jgi:phage terminase large subunit